MSTSTDFGTIPAKKMHPEATLPTRAHADDAGLDLYSLEAGILEPGQGGMARTGVALELPSRTVGLVADRSSMAKKGIVCAGGVIDAGYRGEIHIILRNVTSSPIRWEKGERIAQLLIFPILTPAVCEASELSDSARGTKGFGSSGK